MKCPKCGTDFDSNFCPNCGTRAERDDDFDVYNPPIKKRGRKRGCLASIIAFDCILVVVIIALVFQGKTSTASVPAASGSGVFQESSFANNPDETTGQKNARKSAERYLSTMPFSHDGIIDQLEYEGYTTEEATYAADNCGADWNEQAVKSAKNYLNSAAFSYTGMIKQLEYEKFTTEQATYGADNCEADWNEQAAKSAQNYLETMSFSREGLIDQLVYEGFTQEQAEYGVSQNGY